VKNWLVLLSVTLAVVVIGTFAYVPIQWQVRRVAPAPNPEGLRKTTERLLAQAGDDPEMVQRVQEWAERTRRSEAGEWVSYDDKSPLTRWGWVWTCEAYTREVIAGIESESGERVRWPIVFAVQGIAVLLFSLAVVGLRRRHRRRVPA